MRAPAWRGMLALVGVLVPACASDLDGPTPTIDSVVNEDGNSAICTCDALAGCVKDKNDVLTIAGAGFAPLPVGLLEEPTLELPTVTLEGPGGKSFVIHGDDPTKNPAGVRVDYVDSGTLQLTLTPEYVRDFPPGNYAVAVENPNGNGGRMADAFTVTLGPVLDAVDPAVVCDLLETTITLTGKNFRQGAKVIVGQTELAGVTVVDATTIEATLPKGFAQGTHDVSVVNPEGCASTLTDALQVVPPPQLDSASPQTICTGGTLTLTGKGFLPGATVTIGNTEISGNQVNVQSSTTITVNVGALPPGGPYDISVENADGCGSNALTAEITVIPGPIIVAVDPSTVYSKVAFPITIFGDRLDGVVSATVDTTPPTSMTLKSVSKNRIDAVVPPNIPAGSYDVTVADSKGCTYTFNLNGDALTVTDQLTVAICAVDPPFGYDQEDTSVTITSGSGAGCSAGTASFASTPRAWLDVGGNLTALKSVAFVTSTSLTGTVPAGLTVGGPYDLLVQNPDGGIGLLAKAFKVVDKPVPVIESINPGDTDTQYVGPLTLTGKNFRAPVTIELIDEAGSKTGLSSPTVTGGTQAVASLNVGTLGLSVGAYVVRLTNTDQGTYYDYSALAITNPAGNLGSWTTASDMTTARRRHALVAGRISTARRFLYAIGGDGGGGTPLASVELVPLDKFGGTGTWVAQRSTEQLKTARTGVRAVVKERYLYVLGGQGSAGALNSVERATILDPKQAPEIDTFTFEFVDPADPNQSTLADGVWYYRVSAMMPLTDPDNPGGETLPSDPVVVHAPVKNLKVVLTWKPVAGAVSYNVYRSPTPGGKLGDEQLLADGLTVTTFEDLGVAIKDPSQKPMVIGSTGVFVTLGGVTLATARYDAAVAMAAAGGTARVYLAGGRTGTGAAAVLDTVELATISADGKILGSFQAGTNTLLSKAERGMLAVGENETSPKVPAGTVYLYAAGGHDGAKVYKNGGYSALGAGGQPGAWSVAAEFKSAPHAAVGYMVNDTFYYFGGTDGNNVLKNASSCELTVAPAFQSCNSLAAGSLPSARMNAAIALESAFFYITGGGATDTTADKTVLKTVY